MSQLDPIFSRQFGWGDAIDPATMATDPELAERLLASYNDDEDYSPPLVDSTDAAIDGPLGIASLPVRIYNPEGAPDRAALVWAHGGGFLGGSLEDQEADGVAREIAKHTGATVVSVGYHLADGTNSYPNLHREFAAATRWIMDTASTTGIDVSRIAVGGASAGANLALGAVREMSDEGAPLPAKLVLVYPTLHATLPEGENTAALPTTPALLRIPPHLNAYMFANYIGPHVGAAPYASIEGADLSGLPTTLVIAAEYDDLRVSAELFVGDARAQGVQVVEKPGLGGAHGFLAMSPAVAATERALADISEFVVSE